MNFDINWTTVLASGVTAAIVGSIQLVANRYLVRVLDHIEKSIKTLNKDSNGGSNKEKQ